MNRHFRIPLGSNESHTRKGIRDVFRRISLLGWILILISLYGLVDPLVNTQFTSGWLFQVNLAAAILSLGLIVLMVIFLLRDNSPEAGVSALAALIIRAIATAIVYENLGLVMQLLIIALGAVIAMEWIPHKWMGISMVSIVVFSFGALITDVVTLPWTTETVISQRQSYLIIGSIIVLFLVYVATNFSKYPLRIKLVMGILGINLITIVGVAAVTGTVTYQSVYRDANQSLLASAQNSADSLDDFITINLNNVLSNAAAPILADYLDLREGQRNNDELERRVMSLLNNFSNVDPFFVESYALLDKNGLNLIDTFTPGIGIDESDRDYFNNPLFSGFAYMSPVHVNQSNISSSLYFSAPVRNQDSAIVGILRVRYKADALQKILRDDIGRAGPQSFPVLLDEYNIVVLHSTEPELNQSLVMPLDDATTVRLQETERLPLDLNILQNSSLKQALDQSNETPFFSTETVSENPESGLAAAASLLYQPWKVLFIQPEDTFIQPIESQTNSVILISEAIAFLVMLVSGWGAQYFTRPILNLTTVAQELSQGNLHVQAQVELQDETGLLAETFNSMAAELRKTVTGLELRIAERTKAIETSLQISRQLGTITDLDVLVNSIVELLQSSFGYYHVQIYLYNPNNDVLVVAGGTGEPGRMMVERHHQVPLGRGLVGRAAMTGTVLLVTDTRRDPNWLPNPLLPDTQSEIVVPLLIGNEIIGALDIQQNRIHGLGEEDANVLRLVASQTAVAIRNSQIFRQIRERSEQEALVSSIAEKIRLANSLEEAIQVTKDELEKALHCKQVIIRLGSQLTSELNTR